MNKELQWSLVWFIITTMATAALDVINADHLLKIGTIGLAAGIAIGLLLITKNDKKRLIYHALWGLLPGLALAGLMAIDQLGSLDSAAIKFMTAMTAVVTYYWVGRKPAGSAEHDPNDIGVYEAYGILYLAIASLLIIVVAGLLLMAGQAWLAIAAGMVGVAFLLKSGSLQDNGG